MRVSLLPRISSLFLFSLFLNACGSKPAVVASAEAISEDPSQKLRCDDDDFSGCVEIGRRLVGSKEYILAERAFNIACEAQDPKGCEGIAHISLRLPPQRDHRKRAEVFLVQACELGSLSSCFQLGKDGRLNVAPFNRNKYLYKACQGNLGKACGELGDRYERYYQRYKEAKNYYDKACGLKEKVYCERSANRVSKVRPQIQFHKAPKTIMKKERRIPGPKSLPKETTETSAAPVLQRAGRIFLKRYRADVRKGTYYQVSAGPCEESGCSFQIQLLKGNEVLDEKNLRWSSTAGPIEKAGNSSMAAGYENHYVGTQTRGISFGPHLLGIEVIQEKGFDKVQHRSDIYISVDGSMVRVPWTHDGLRAKDTPPELSAIMVGLMDSKNEAERVLKEFSDSDCSRDLLILKSDPFPKLSPGKWIVGQMALGEESERVVTRWRQCFSELEAQVFPLY